MSFEAKQITPEQLINETQAMFDADYRLVTATCVDEIEQFRIIYSFDRETELVNLEVAIGKQDELPSISGVYLCAFLVENEIKEFVNLYGYTTFKVATNVNHASYKRTARLKERIREAVASGSAWFITITFSPETLENTNEKTRRTYVSRWLKSLTPFYVANIDYGKKKGREHYHAVITSDERPPKSWSYGFVDILKVSTTETDTKRISKYISKLTNHAIKNTTKSKRIIYSRKPK